MKYRNRHTGEIGEVVKEEVVNLDGKSTVRVYQLDDGSRWQAGLLFAHWEEVTEHDPAQAVNSTGRKP